MTPVRQDYRNSHLLLLLCNDSFTERQVIEIKNAASEVSDWEAFSELAIKNGVAAIVWDNLEECGLAFLVPEKIQDRLEALKNKTIARTVFISAAAAEMTKLLEAKGIRMVLLKGLALEHTVYGGRGLRQMSDADVLIAPQQSAEGWRLLQTDGYTCRPLKSALYKRIIMHLGNHLPELHKNGISVDVHHRLFQKEGTALTLKGINEAPAINISGTKCYVLPPRLAFLGLVKHIQKHGVKGEFQVRLYIDLFLLLKYHREEIMSTGLLNEAEEAGISRDLSAAFYLLSEKWDINIPEEYFSYLTYSERKDYSSAFMEGLNNPGKADPDRSRDIYTYNLRSIDGWFNKLIFLVGDLFPSVDFMKERYSKKSLPAILPYYLLRLAKLFWFLRALVKKQ